MIPAASWMLTYAVHSTLLLGVAWLLGRVFGERRLALQETAWKVALVGGLLTATVQLGLGLQPLGGTWPLTPLPPPSASAETPATIELPKTAAISAHQTPAAASGEVAAISPSPPAAVPAPAAVDLAGISETVAGEGAAGAALWPLAAVVVWLAVAALLLAGLAVAYLRLSRRLADRWPVTGGVLAALFGRLVDRSGRRRPVRLTATRRLGIPIAWGLAHGEITLPAALVDGLSPYHQESILAHELAHLQRRDPLWLAAGRVIECALFFQPLNRLARRRLQEIAEYRCDDRAAELTGRPLELARCLTEVAAWRLDEARGLPVSAMASRSGLSARVRRLADRSWQAGERLPRWFGAAVAAVLLLVALAAPAITGQEPPPAPPAPQAPEAPQALAAPPAPPAPESLPAPEAAPAPAVPEVSAAPPAPETPATPEVPAVAEVPPAPAVPRIAPVTAAPAPPRPSATPQPGPAPAPLPRIRPSRGAVPAPAPLPEPSGVTASPLPSPVVRRLGSRLAARLAPQPILVSTGGVEETGPERDLSNLTSASRAEREAALSRLEAELDTLEARIDDAVERHEEALDRLEERSGEDVEDDHWEERLEAGLERLEEIHERIADRLVAGLEDAPAAARTEIRTAIEGHLRDAFRAHRDLERELARLHAATARIEAGALHAHLNPHLSREERDALREEARRHAELARREVEREMARTRELREREMARHREHLEQELSRHRAQREREMDRVRDELRAAQREVERQNRELVEQNRELQRMQREELGALAHELAETHRAAAEAGVAGDERRREELERQTEQLQEQLEAVHERLEERHEELVERSLELREQALERLHERLEQMNEELEQEMEAEAEAIEEEVEREEP